jgi:type IV pilus assembly protein PilY1
MNTQSIRNRFLPSWLMLLGMTVSAAAGAATCTTAQVTAGTCTSLADAAIYSTVVVPANTAFDLSVEYPTATSDAYNSISYSTSYEFYGYFNPNYCYDYTLNTGAGALTPQFETLAGYFAPVAAASGHTCSGHWSGNYLNWVMTQTIDPLRKTVTGGARIVDTASTTVLQKAYQSATYSTQSVKSITGSLVAGATPLSSLGWTTVYTMNQATGLNFVFSSSSSPSYSGATAYGSPVCPTASANMANGGSSTSPSGTVSKTGFSVTTSGTALSVVGSSSASCGGTDTITVLFGSSYSTQVNLAVTGCPTGVSCQLSSSAVTGSTGSSTQVALTFAVTGSPSTGSSNITITGTPKSGSANSQSVTLKLTIASLPTTYYAQAAMQVCASGELTGTSFAWAGATVTNLQSGGKTYTFTNGATYSTSDKEGNSYPATAPDGSTVAVTGRCRSYSSSYKPIGLMQKYAAENATQNDSIRYSVFGYMLDNQTSTANQNLDGGVMRARMAYVGPYQASPGATPVVNTNPEWDGGTGMFYTNPDSADASNTPAVTYGGTTNGPTNQKSNPVSRSGVANYLNMFGFVPVSQYQSSTRTAYKVYDSVSELYYMATRYFRNGNGALPNLASHTSTASAITSGEATNDNFPVIENWDDPIQYTCSTNYIIGIGDIHTWNDTNLPGATAQSSYEIAAYAPKDDSAVAVSSATDYIAKLENLAGDTGGVTGRSSYYTAATGLGDALIGNIASPSGGWGASQNSFYMAGLAFDAHVRDIRPDLTQKNAPITISTFWLDVYENADYHQKNQFWMTAKYGGFDTTNTYPISGTTSYSPFPINPNATNQVNPNNSGTADGQSGAANTYTPGTPSITFPAGSGAATTTAQLPLSAWCGTGGQSCNTDNHGNYMPDQYYQAASPAKMSAGLGNAFANIVATKPAGTGTALALSSNSVASTGNTNYVINYDNNYGGDIQAQQVTFAQTGGVISQTGYTLLWDARSFLPPSTGAGALTATGTTGSRLIATSSAQGKGNGVQFELANISTAQKTALSSSTANNAQLNVLNYLRGDMCNENTAGTAFTAVSWLTSAQAAACNTTTGNTTSLGYRARVSWSKNTAGTWVSKGTVLGDIVNAQPVIVGAPSAQYGDAPLNPGYSAFKTTMTTTSGSSARGTMLYIGANDGMMHAFDTSTGIERFAYVPSALFTTNTDSNGNAVGLASLTVSPLQHHFMVDGQAVVADVDFARSGVSGGTGNANWSSAVSLPTDWRSVLIGGLGKGGGSSVTSGTCTTNCKVGGGYYAIDVTNPTATAITVPSSVTTNPTSTAGLSAITSEAALANKVLWEINQSSADFAHMGYSYGTPLVIKTKNYGWTLVLTSGYDNDDGSGWIYLVNPATGALLEKISTGVGNTSSPAGLAQVTAFIPDVSDYTADALYAGDLLGNVWRVDLTTSSMQITKFATLISPSDGNAQPITTYPFTGTDPTSGTRYVFVGTGKLLADTDLVLSQTQTFYAFQDGTSTGFDTSDTFPITRSMLVADNLTNGVTAELAPAGSARGFYIDLAAAVQASNNTASQASAERITVQPVAYSGVVGFAANLEGQDVCIKGTSRVFALNFDSGYTFNGAIAGIGQSIILDSTGAVANYVGYSTGLVTNLGFGTSTSGLSGSGTPAISLLIGLDTGSKTTVGSTTGGVATNRLNTSQTRLNWREVQNGQ